MSTDANKLADIMIRRRAKKEGVALTENYWNSVLWKKKYREQVVAAHSLLKVYSYRAIVTAINHKDMTWAYSLRTKQLIPYIKDEENRLQSIKKQAKESKPVEKPQEEPTGPRKVFGYGKKSILKKLD